MSDQEQISIFVKRQADVAAVFQVTPMTVSDWKSRNMPGKRGKWDLVAIGEWLQERSLGPWLNQPDDPLMNDRGQPDSPSLERYRAAQASLAELKLAEAEGRLIDVSEVHKFHAKWAGIIRRAGEKIQRDAGCAHAHRLWTEALAECERLIGGSLPLPCKT